MTGTLSRRTLLGGAAGAVALTAFASSAARAATGLRVYVLVVDGCRPDEAAGAYLPTLRSLAAQGTSFAAARSITVAETIPNHVAMMTGVYPNRSGVPANSVWDPALGEVRDLGLPTDLRTSTLLERLPAELGLATAGVLSKDYLYGVFGERASHRWTPEPMLPITNHAPDVFTMGAVLDAIDDHDPALLFANLGDVDRFGHADLTGWSIRLLRTLALIDTDAQLARFVAHLRRSGLWESSVVIVLADHSMDWSLPLSLVNLAGRLDDDPLLDGNVQVAQNGGADLLYWTGPPDTRAEAVARMRQVALAAPGVLSAHDPAELRLGTNAGDLVVYCKAGWRFTDPTVISNPIPGNHGHPATEQIPFVVSGGHPTVRRGQVSSVPVRTLDVAPTVASLFGLPAPAGGWDGQARTEAFTGALVGN
ncbi:MAG: alkaline phosphatase family protein [Actinophytocola sp.]|uniref:alkaline phosphatase family protein n=1 Tax=Actinophytocola sp. TaxID=1872138 RepID=UPI00132A3C46|nr:alkaline phosphatase family protein [Actinophytocola sp.]MPZ79948.1 alkaline phosphatase family protein [Actinophytocola sp.]